MSSLQNDDFFDKLILEKNVSSKDIKKALEIVKQFIIDRQLILVGGIAIDFALKLKNGKGIYSEFKLPDYDFYSSNHFSDAYDLAQILCREGLPNVSCISALHPTTMRVRVDFEVVADITYCPQEIFNNIPILMWQRMKFVHPLWQYMDFHISLSGPFNHPGQEVIFERWEKDLQRRIMLLEYYNPSEFLKNKNIVDEYNVKLPEGDDHVLSGIYGYAILYEYFKLITKDTNKDIIPVNISNTSSTDINYKCVITTKKDDTKSLYSSFMEKRPPKIITKDNEEHYILEYDSISIFKYKDYNVACYEYIALYFLVKYFEEKDERALAFYCSTLKMSEILAMHEVRGSPFDLSLQVFGNKINKSDEIRNIKFEDKIEKRQSTILLPSNYHPSKKDDCKDAANYDFTYENNPLFALNGKLFSSEKNKN